MKIRRDLVKDGDSIKQYIYIDLEESYEFGLDFFKKDDKNSFVYKLKEYVKSIINNVSNDSAVLIINGIMVGTLSLSAFLGAYNKKMSEDTSKIILSDSASNEEISNLNFTENFFVKAKSEDTKIEEDVEPNSYKGDDEISTLDIAESTGVDVDEYSEKINSNVEKVESRVKESNESINNNIQNQISSPVNSVETSNTQNEVISSNNSNEEIVKEEEKQSVEPIVEEPKIPQGIIIKLNLGGNVIDIELEEYLVGVVGAEMPASFNVEALKAQAVAARTYALKKYSAGKILSASVSDQAYKTVDQLRSAWGSSFDYYYNKVRDAVYSTKGMVMKYNGQYIDALYHAISSGKTELPIYVWNSSYPYLVSVDSSLDRNVKNYQVTNFLDYGSLSSKLGVTVNEETPVEVISYTESGRVNEIKIGNSVFTGVNVRSKLGLRSADFTIEKAGTGVNITTRGYGHGVGMSQYGANEYAKQGWSFSQILTHYYTGIYFEYV